MENNQPNLGIAPVGHRVTISTPEFVEITHNIRVVLAPGITEGQIRQRFNEIVEQYYADFRQFIFDEWERTYYANIGIANAYVNLREDIEGVTAFLTEADPLFTGAGMETQEAYSRLMDLHKWFPAERAKQAHVFPTVINSQEIGVELRRTNLISAIDFRRILTNGEDDPNGYTIWQSQEMMYIPRMVNLDIEIVPFIEPWQPPGPPVDVDVKHYLTGFDRPMSKLSVLSESIGQGSPLL